MQIYANKKEICSLLEIKEEKQNEVNLKIFTDLHWSQGGMVLSTSRNLFLNKIVVKVTFPSVLAEQRTSKELLTNAIAWLFAQANERYALMLLEKAQKEKKANKQEEKPVELSTIIADPAKA